MALVPENDPMTLVRGTVSAAKTGLYRSSVGQPAISPSNNGVDGPRGFCANMIRIQAQFLQHSQAALARAPTPVPAVGNNLFTFMASRLVMSFGNLHCHHYGLTDPVRVVRNAAGVAVGVRFGTPRYIPPPLSHGP